MIRLLIFGPTGSMGRLITRLALQDPDIDVVGACDINEIGKSLEELVGVRDPNSIMINHSKNLKELLQKTSYMFILEKNLLSKILNN